MRHDRVVGVAVAARLAATALVLRRPRLTPAQRLAEFPRTAPVTAPMRIRWNRQQIPFIEAQDDDDLAVGIGMVHAHLRLAQMEIMRRAAQGRLSEYAGPLALDADRTLLLLDLGRAVPAIIEGMTPASRAWADGFLRGVNHVLMQIATLPEEMRLLGIGREPWTLADLLTSARLAAADVGWALAGRLLRARAAMPEADWRALWPRLVASGAGSPGMPAPAGLEALLARGGSNAAAIAARRSRSGGALLAADPHLSLALPNIWLAIGLQSPTLNAVGLMPAGFPVMAIGRNAGIAWGGTSLHAASSDLIDLRHEAIETRHVRVRVRGLGHRTLSLRHSRHGPVVSDGLLFKNREPIALRWIGHSPSDEIGAMLGVLRAADSAQFASALSGFAVPGLNMLHATAAGHVGHLLALAAPRRAAGCPADLVLPPEAAAGWADLAQTPDFPNRMDPPDGLVASANDEPPPGKVPAGYFFSSPDRIERLRALLGGDALLDLEDLAAAQRDVQGRLAAVRAIAARLPDHSVRTRLLAWDGRYEPASTGAVLFETMMAALSDALPGQPSLRPMLALWTGRRARDEAVLQLDDAVLHPLAVAAMDTAQRRLRRHRRWGAMHRIRLRHYLGAVPVLGLRHRYGSYPAPGGNDTLNKTGHAAVHGRHAVSYGASARFLADMADPDENHVVLLGGQDGWLGSDSFLDQVPLWRRGRMINLPLRPASVRDWPHVTEVRPA